MLRNDLMAPAIMVSEPSTIHWATGRLVSSSVEGGVPRLAAGERATLWERSSGRMKAARTRAALIAVSASSMLVRRSVTFTTRVASTIWIRIRLSPVWL